MQTAIHIQEKLGSCGISNLLSEEKKLHSEGFRQCKKELQIFS